LKIKNTDSVWFLKTPIGKNTLGQLRKELIEGFGINAKGRVFSNKISHKIGISRMEDALVPIKKGMRITRHRFASFIFFYLIFCCIVHTYLLLCILFRDAKTYAKYNAIDYEID
jgi:hypothetical protein